MQLVKVLICFLLVLLSGWVIYLDPPNRGAVVAAWIMGVISFIGFMSYLDALK